MFYRHADGTLNESVVDLISWGGNAVISCHDSSLRMYRDETLLKKSILPCMAYKLAVSSKLLVAVALNGEAYILNEDFQLVHVFKTIEWVSSLAIAHSHLLVSSWACGVCLYRFPSHENIDEKAKPIPVLLWIKKSTKRVTASAIDESRIAVSLENTLVFMDLTGNEIFKKDLSCNITSLKLTAVGIFIGLNSGKIHYEHFTNKEESFIFNAHYELAQEKKIFYPITDLHYDGYLYSSGIDGRINKWSIEKKRHIGCLGKFDSSVDKFLVLAESIYVVANNESRSGSSTLLYSAIE